MAEDTKTFEEMVKDETAKAVKSLADSPISFCYGERSLNTAEQRSRAPQDSGSMPDLPTIDPNLIRHDGLRKKSRNPRVEKHLRQFCDKASYNAKSYHEGWERIFGKGAK